MFPAKYWVEKLKMQSHPEGGFFAENLSFDPKRLTKTLYLNDFRVIEISAPAFIFCWKVIIFRHFTAYSLTKCGIFTLAMP
jgi:hypothetical protein